MKTILVAFCLLQREKDQRQAQLWFGERCNGSWEPWPSQWRVFACFSGSIEGSSEVRTTWLL